MPDSKEQAQAAEQEAQNAKGDVPSTAPLWGIPSEIRLANRSFLLDPNHPAHPEHPKVAPMSFSLLPATKHANTVQHGEWIKNAGKKFGNAAIFGAGATAGRDAIQGAINQV